MPNYRHLAERLEELADVPSRVAAPVAKAIGGFIEEGFARGDDPYGVRWAALKPATRAKGRRPPPLTDTGAMRASVAVKPTQGAGIEIRIDADYAKFHQTGTTPMAARPILPAGSELPEAWEDAIEAATDDEFARTLKGGR